MDAKTRHLIGKSSEETSIRDIDIRDRLRARKAIPKKAVPKTAVSRPIIEFGGIEGSFLLVDSRPFWEATFWGTAFLARNQTVDGVDAYLTITVDGVDAYLTITVDGVDAYLSITVDAYPGLELTGRFGGLNPPNSGLDTPS